ncbi:MAG TPA: hypothetical protein PK445_03890 [Methanolinea sp.]|nr:hypothetical protein [Methanolinea sp.]
MKSNINHGRIGGQALGSPAPDHQRTGDKKQAVSRHGQDLPGITTPGMDRPGTFLRGKPCHFPVTRGKAAAGVKRLRPVTRLHHRSRTSSRRAGRGKQTIPPAVPSPLLSPQGREWQGAFFFKGPAPHKKRQPQKTYPGSIPQETHRETGKNRW